jgi:amino acid transporter
VQLSWWVIALAAWALVGTLGLLRVDINGKVLAVLIGVEMIILVIYDISFAVNPAAEGFSLTTLAPSNLLQGGIGAGLVLAITGYVGFEGAAVFSEEAKNPRRTVMVATYVTLAVMAFVYGLSSWLMSVAAGPSKIVERSRTDSVDLLYNLAAARLGEGFLVDAGRVLFLTSLVAALMSFHNTVARYLFALGREGVLPRAFGRTGRRTGAPVVGSLMQTTVALIVILVYLLTDADPLVRLFFWGGMFGGFGVLSLLAITSFAVIGYFARDPRGENPWSRLIAPAVAAVLLVEVLYLAVDNFATLLGPPVTADSTLTWALPAVFPAAMLVGVLWALALRATSPRTYASIGLGGNASAMSTMTGSVPLPGRPTPGGGVGA